MLLRNSYQELFWYSWIWISQNVCKCLPKITQLCIIVMRYLFSWFLSRPRSATLSLSRLLSSPKLQPSPHLCTTGQTRSPLLPSWTTRTLASWHHRPSRVRFRARFLCCSPPTLREHHQGLPVPVWLSRNSSVVSLELQVRVQQRPTQRYGHMTHFRIF